MNPSPEFYLHGEPDGLSEARRLRAGPFDLIFEAGDLRYIRWGGREVLRRIYPAVRDQDWGTVPGVITHLAIHAEADRFRIIYTSDLDDGTIGFTWKVEIIGDPDGTIRFAAAGVARRDFLHNRVGICVLHPIRECAGAHCRARYADGSTRLLRFPSIVAVEQPVRDLHDLAGLAHEVEPGWWAELTFEGGVFETEDQRNWIDASFKTYAPPLRLPHPVETPSGTRFQQSVTLRLVEVPGDGGSPAYPVVISNQSAEEGPVTITLSGRDARPLPSLGLGMASHGHGLTPQEVDRLTRVQPAHLRCDLKLSDPDWRKALARAGTDSVHLGAPLELVVHLPAGEEGDLVSVARAVIRLRADLARILILRDGRPATRAEDVRSAKACFADFGVPIGGGTDADLYQLNLHRPSTEDFEVIGWTMNPQVHAFDRRSIAETPEGAAHQVASARNYFPGKSLAISAISLRPRFNPVASGSRSDDRADRLPAPVDRRQLSLFAAGWTVGMIKALAEAGVDSATFFETTGWRGLMECEAGAPRPDLFPSMPGEVFPLYHVLAEVGGFAGGQVIPSVSSDPLSVTALGLHGNGRQGLIVANLGGEMRRVRLAGGRSSLRPNRLRRLDGSNLRQASTTPEDWRRSTFEGAQGPWELPPFALLFLDAALRI